MAPNLSLFGRTKQLELQIDSFFDKVSEAAVVFRLGVRVYLKEGYTEEFVTRLDRVVELESEADVLRRDIEKHLYSNTLIPDSRGDVLGLIETMDQLLSEFEDTLWAFSIEKPTIPEELGSGYRKLTNMVIKSVDELDLSFKIQLREFADRIDGIADLAEDVADRLAIYAIKRLT